MSLWTPDGEHPVQPTSSPSSHDMSAPDFPGDTFDDSQLSPEDQERAHALATEMAEVRKEMLGAPAAVVVANHAMGLYELAAIHLGAPQPNLSEAQVAIDAYGALVDAVGDRLGPDGATLRDALAQIRLAFVQIKAGTAPVEKAPAPTTDNPDTPADDADTLN